MTGFEATCVAPISYGPQQIADRTFKIVLADNVWNTTGTQAATRHAEFTKMVNNVGFNQI